jgi:hypothetical protein
MIKTISAQPCSALLSPAQPCSALLSRIENADQCDENEDS